MTEAKTIDPAEKKQQEIEGWQKRALEQLSQERNVEVVKAGAPQPGFSSKERSDFYQFPLSLKHGENTVDTTVIMKLVNKTVKFGEVSPRPDSHFDFEGRVMDEVRRKGKGLFIDFLAHFHTERKQIILTPKYNWDLEGLLDSKWMKSWGNLFVVTSSMCRSTEFLHQRDWIHGDIKPSNFFVTEDGRIKMSDLEGVRSLHDEEARTFFEGFLTPAYSDLRLLTREAQADKQSDIFALATSIYRLVSGGKFFYDDGRSSLTPVYRVSHPHQYTHLSTLFFPGTDLPQAMQADQDSTLGLLHQLDTCLQRAVQTSPDLYPAYNDVAQFRQEVEVVMAKLEVLPEAQKLLDENEKTKDSVPKVERPNTAEVKVNARREMVRRLIRHLTIR